MIKEAESALKIPQTFCAIHTEKQVISVCLDQQCPYKGMFCYQCVKIHFNHLDKTFEIKDFLNVINENINDLSFNMLPTSPSPSLKDIFKNKYNQLSMNKDNLLRQKELVIEAICKYVDLVIETSESKIDVIESKNPPSQDTQSIQELTIYQEKFFDLGNLQSDELYDLLVYFSRFIHKEDDKIEIINYSPSNNGQMPKNQSNAIENDLDGTCQNLRNSELVLQKLTGILDNLPPDDRSAHQKLSCLKVAPQQTPRRFGQPATFQYSQTPSIGGGGFNNTNTYQHNSISLSNHFQRASSNQNNNNNNNNNQNTNGGNNEHSHHRSNHYSNNHNNYSSQNSGQNNNKFANYTNIGNSQSNLQNNQQNREQQESNNNNTNNINSNNNINNNNNNNNNINANSNGESGDNNGSEASSFLQKFQQKLNENSKNNNGENSQNSQSNNNNNNHSNSTSTSISQQNSQNNISNNATNSQNNQKPSTSQNNQGIAKLQHLVQQQNAQMTANSNSQHTQGFHSLAQHFQSATQSSQSTNNNSNESTRMTYQQKKQLQYQQNSQKRNELFSEQRLSLRSVEHFCDALEVGYNTAWCISFRTQKECAFNGIYHMPIFVYDSTVGASLESAYLSLSLYEGSSSFSKKLYEQSFYLKKTNKQISSDETNLMNVLEKININTSYKLRKNSDYTIVVRNKTSEQEDQSNLKQLYILYGDDQAEELKNQPESEGAKLITFIKTNTTNLSSHLENTKLITQNNDSLDDPELTDYFIPYLSLSQVSVDQQFYKNNFYSSSNAIGTEEENEQKTPKRIEYENNHLGNLYNNQLSSNQNQRGFKDFMNKFSGNQMGNNSNNNENEYKLQNRNNQGNYKRKYQENSQGNYNSNRSNNGSTYNNNGGSSNNNTYQQSSYSNNNYEKSSIIPGFVPQKKQKK